MAGTDDVRAQLVTATLRRALGSRCSDPFAELPSPREVFELTARTAVGLGQSVSSGEFGLCASMSSTYVQLFAPRLGRLAPAAALDPATFVWRSDNGSVIADVLGVGAADAKSVWVGVSRPEARQLASAGSARFGDRFSGLRVLAMSAPARSLVLSPFGDGIRLLAETTLWPPSLPILDLGVGR